MTTFDIEFAPDGRIIDFLDEVMLEDTPEERVRQRFLRTLHFEHGYAKTLMRREVTIMAGSNPAIDREGNPIRADIVVYQSPAARQRGDQGQIKFVVECKRPEVTEGYNQLVSYIFNTSAGGGVWTNSEEDVQPFRRFADPENRLEPAPGFPRDGETWDAVGRRRRDQLERPRDVRGLLRLCHNKLHGRGVDNDEEDLTMDMVRIILAKARDEIGEGALPNFYVTPDEYRSAGGQEAVAERVQQLFREFAEDNPGVFDEHERIGVSSAAITEVVAVLQPYEIMTRIEDADEWDIMGSAYEQYTAAHLKRQRGQFFTNRLLVDFMVSLFDPGPDVKALDPAGGSGGFLTGVLRHVRRKVLAAAGSDVAQQHQLANLRQHLFMVEASPRLVKIAKTAMLLNGDGHSGMTRGDSLGPYEELDEWIRARCFHEEPTLILTNPPFAGQGEGQITDAQKLGQYNLGHRWVRVGDSVEPTDRLLEGAPPEMLFFERCLDWLSPGGHLGIVMPKSFLDTATYRPAREQLFQEAQLMAVLNCHKNTFQPDTGVRTCVLFLRKLGRGEDPPEDHEIFMAISRKIGRDSEGRPIFKIDPDGETTDQLDYDLGEVLADYRQAHTGSFESSGYRFVVRRSELDVTLNINPQRYLPHLNESLREVQEMDGLDGWTVTSLSQIEQGITIFKGPRLRTEPLIVEDPASGTEVEPYYPPSAVLQDRRDSLKWLDLSRATARQLRNFEQVRVRQGDLLITRSGSIGRIAYITSRLDGAIVSDDAIRVRIKNPELRAYVFAHLQSSHAQNQLLRNEYGAVQQHLEPHHVSDLLIPIPDDWDRVSEMIELAQNHFEAKEAAENASAQLVAAVKEMMTSTA
jgi:type I restriction-modification system DNA methylase subunit